MKAKDIVVWVNSDTKQVLVRSYMCGVPTDRKLGGYWCDPIGAAYQQWREMTDQQRMQLMLETVIDLGMQGYPLKLVLEAFATVDEFHALGKQSYPMCRALTAALVGRCLEPNTMSFEELLVQYGSKRDEQEGSK
jgi:hypothetical protein